MVGTKKGTPQSKCSLQSKVGSTLFPESSDHHRNTGEITALGKGIRCGANPKLDYKQ